MEHEERTINKEYNVAGRNPITYLELLKTVSENYTEKRHS